MRETKRKVTLLKMLSRKNLRTYENFYDGLLIIILINFR